MSKTHARWLDRDLGCVLFPFEVVCFGVTKSCLCVLKVRCFNFFVIVYHPPLGQKKTQIYILAHFAHLYIIKKLPIYYLFYYEGT